MACAKEHHWWLWGTTLRNMPRRCGAGAAESYPEGVRGYAPRGQPEPRPLDHCLASQAALIKEAIKSGILNSAEAMTIQADTNREQTGGMYLRIRQIGDACTEQASNSRYAPAKRTLRSGHYFYESPVSTVTS